jgi:nucleotidyltransferase-like protein
MAPPEPGAVALTQGRALRNLEPDPQYVAARTVLLDALEALAQYRDSLIIVGAQAVYLRTEHAQLGVAVFTIDGDIAINPATFPSAPPLETALTDAGFVRGAQPGSWARAVSINGREITVDIDFMVPAAVAPGTGSRSVELAGHDRLATRRVHGLEAALVDHGPMQIVAIDRADARRIQVQVAGPAALVIAKVHKIVERVESARGARTLVDKDAGDIYRLIQVTRVPEMAAGFRKALGADASHAVADSALNQFDGLFGKPTRPGVEMAVRAVSISGEASETIRAALTGYVSALLREI